MRLPLLQKRAVKKSPVQPRKAWLDVDGRDVPVIISENVRAKRLTLRIQPGGEELRMSVPPHTAYGEIDGFLQKHRNWVAAKIARMPRVRAIADGAEIMLRGVPHIIVHQGRGRGLVKGVDDNGDMQLHVFGDIRHLPRRVVDYLKKQARADLAKAVEFHSERLGVKAKSISIRDSKTRWGSCSSNGTLSFSWRIILAPPEILDYLAAHEVAHLREMNHSSRFWKLVDETCPHSKSSRQWLKMHGSTLHALAV